MRINALCGRILMFVWLHNLYLTRIKMEKLNTPLRSIDHILLGAETPKTFKPFSKT